MITDKITISGTMVDYTQSDFPKLFSGEKAGERYDSACADYTTPQRLVSGLAQQVQNLKLPSPKTVVALAIGTGLETEEVKKKFPNVRVIGVDLSTDMLKRAQEEERVDEVVVANITQKISEIEDHQADVVVCCGGTEFNPGKLADIANEMARMVKPGGLLSITYRPPEQEEARPGYAYYSQEDIQSVFSNMAYLSSDEHVSFSMNKKSDQSSLQGSTNEGKEVDVVYETSFFQAPECSPE